MKLGMVSYPMPDGIDAFQRLEWSIDKAVELGLAIIGGFPTQTDANYLKRIRDHADVKGIEIEPYVRGVFGLVGPTAKESLVELIDSIAAAKALASHPYVHTGYGGLNVETSRFNKKIPIQDHLAGLAANLREAARVEAHEGVIIAVENRCDFVGRELADIIVAVDPPNVQACLDTGNSLTVLSNPTADLIALARFTVTTHLKDLTVIAFGQPGQVPSIPVGCVLGEGEVDVGLTIRTLVEQSPRGRDTPLILEQGWVPVAEGGNRAEVYADVFAASIASLRTNFGEYLSA